MATFNQFLSEKFNNAFTVDEKQPYADAVWDILQSSYKAIGGLKGSGFGSKKEMIRSIPFWKVASSDGQVRAVLLYKDKGGRKMVALGTDGSSDGKRLLKNMVKQDFSRAFSEMSGPLLAFVKKHFPDMVKKYKLHVDEVKELMPEYDITPINDYDYTRLIGGNKIAKMMIGTPGKSITK